MQQIIMYKMAMDNIFMAVTNLYGLRTVHYAWMTGQYPEMCVTFTAILASIAYHLAESRKHNMRGVIMLRPYEKLLLHIDRLCAGTMCCVYLVDYYDVLFNSNIMGYAMISVISMMISESAHIIHYPPVFEKYMFMITHSYWHVSAFHVAYLVLNTRCLS